MAERTDALVCGALDPSLAHGVARTHAAPRGRRVAPLGVLILRASGGSVHQS
jgi:hypothetical protein